MQFPNFFLAIKLLFVLVALFCSPQIKNCGKFSFFSLCFTICRLRIVLCLLSLCHFPINTKVPRCSFCSPRRPEGKLWWWEKANFFFHSYLTNSLFLFYWPLLFVFPFLPVIFYLINCKYLAASFFLSRFSRFIVVVVAFP